MSDWSWKQAVAEFALRHTNATGDPRFSINDVYAQQELFAQLFPSNRHVKEKLRQTLQRLRDDGLLVFLGGGDYQINRDYEDLVVDDNVQIHQGISQPESRTIVRTLRLRCTVLSTEMKRRYGWSCQVCRIPVILGRQRLYAESHHLKPLGAPHFGPDVPGNIIVLCPNHHVMFDRGAVVVSPDKLTVRHVVPDAFPEGCSLFVDRWHRLEPAYLTYHQENIFGAS